MSYGITAVAMGINIQYNELLLSSVKAQQIKIQHNWQGPNYMQVR